MHIAILTFEGYNELDSLIALGVLNRVRKPDWRVSIASPTPRVRSMNGVVIESHVSLEEASAADAVIVGSGRRTREVVADQALMSHNALSFYIEAELWAQPIPLRLFLKTEIDLEDGNAHVVDAGSAG